MVECGVAASDNDNRLVTVKELKEEVSKLPTRWEVRFLILAAVVTTQAVPQLHLPATHAGALALKLVGL